MEDKNGIQNNKNNSKIDKGVETNSFLMNYVKKRNAMNSFKRTIKINKLDLNKICNIENSSNSSYSNTHSSFRENNFPIVFNYSNINTRNIIKPKGDQTLTLLPNKLLKTFNNKNNCNLYESFYKKENYPFNDLLLNYRNNIKQFSKTKLQKKINKNKIEFSNQYIKDNLSKKDNKSNRSKGKQYKSSSYSKREISLLDNPDSFLYHIYHHAKNNLKNIKKNEQEENIEEYKEVLKENQNEVLRQLFLLKKEINLVEQNKLTGKALSTKTFMDLKIYLK